MNTHIKYTVFGAPNEHMHTPQLLFDKWNVKRTKANERQNANKQRQYFSTQVEHWRNLIRTLFLLLRPILSFYLAVRIPLNIQSFVRSIEFCVRTNGNSSKYTFNWISIWWLHRIAIISYALFFIHSISLEKKYQFHFNPIPSIFHSIFDVIISAIHSSYTFENI